MRAENFSARAFDAGGELAVDRVREVRAVLEREGAVHVQNTGINSVEGVQACMPGLGFTEATAFAEGGRTSSAKQIKWAAPGLRRMDHYAESLYLLPNNEVQYRRTSPRWVMLACLTPAAGDGGRIFLHSATAVEDELRARDPALLDRILAHGLTIETGFLDQRHPAKAGNYFHSWQAKYETTDPEEALRRAASDVDEVDAAWWRDDAGMLALMTRITLAAYWPADATDADVGGVAPGRRFLRFPRIAMDGPAAHNGFRRFPLGDGSELTPAEIETLRAAFLATREGIPLAPGDVVLFDNKRFGHSRESFTGTERRVLVGMAGVIDDRRPAPVAAGGGGTGAATAASTAVADASTAPTAAAPLAPRPAPLLPLASRDRSSSHAYSFPHHLVDFSRRFPMRVFDARGALATGSTMEQVNRELDRHGAVHVRNTGIFASHGGALPEDVLSGLRFGREHAFAWGGLQSGRTERRSLSKELRATDEYPASLWLLPHNEVLYQRNVPQRLLFFNAFGGDVDSGGRTFVHCAKRVESFIAAQGTPGRRFLDGLRARGLSIETGFPDQRHPARHTNYFRSWQERFGTDDEAEAEERCRASTHQFHACWWRDEGPLARGTTGTMKTLMTRVVVPAYHGDTLLFPRIALDAPAFQNGYRVYSRGDGTAFSPEEVDMLLHAFLDSREGVHYGPGDILLVDNLRYGHSREAFNGARSLGVAMAGSVTIW